MTPEPPRLGLEPGSAPETGSGPSPVLPTVGLTDVSVQGWQVGAIGDHNTVNISNAGLQDAAPVTPTYTTALVVGVERYAVGPTWDLDGPALDAARFARWLVDRGVPRERVTLLVSPLPRNDAAVRETTRGLHTGEADFTTVLDVLTRELPESTSELLVIYWAGHGVVDSADARRVIYADATLSDRRNLDITNLMKSLRSSTYAGHPLQLLIVDASMSRVEKLGWAETMPSVSLALGSIEKRNQFALFAASPGEQATYDRVLKSGLFSQVVIEVLDALPDDVWPPDAKALRNAVNERFEALRGAGRSRQVPSYIGYVSPSGEEALVHPPDSHPSPRDLAAVPAAAEDAPSSLQLAAYAADTADGNDDLDIGPAVDALAALVCARAVDPPLSIGLFGAWGSGKSFFMRRLERQVHEIGHASRESGRSQPSLWAWRNVRQVRFNAWHYSSADVWAGLLEHLLRALAATHADRLALPAELDTLQRRRVERVVGAQLEERAANDDLTAAHRELERARAAVERAKSDLERTQHETTQTRRRQATEEALKDAHHTLDRTLGSLGLEHGAQTFEELWQQLTVARQQADVLTGFARDPRGRRWLALALLTGPALGVVVAVALWLVNPPLAGVGSAVAGLAGVSAALAGWLRAGTTWVRRRLDAIETAERAAREAEQHREAILAEASERERQAAAAVTVTEELAERCLKQVQRVEEAATGSHLGDLLREYLAERADSQDYRSRLGLIGTVRGDLEVISDAVALHNSRIGDADWEADGDDVVNRVVLYVDDLDRCPPDVVVRVLEAVHLLLSFELFVVVVAVDASWVSRSLRAVYPQLLASGDVSADQYLEKIFQFPVWLDPPGHEAARKMALALMDDGPRKSILDLGEKTVRATSAPDSTAATNAPDDARPARAEGHERPASAAPRGLRETGSVSDERTPAPEPTPPTATSLTAPPHQLVLDEEERADIAILSPVLARSPRALKRYVNTYRLMKALLDDRHQLRHARFLLAVCTGRPSIGERLLHQAQAEKPDTTLGVVADALPDADREWLDTILSVPRPDWRQLSCDELAPVATTVNRFLFRASTPE